MKFDWREELRRQAEATVGYFVEVNEAFSVDDVQPDIQGSTNYVMLGRRGDEPVLFKFFCLDERKMREVYGMRHWADTGAVPKLLGENEARLVVMSIVPGDGVEWDQLADPERAGFTLGQATAKLVETPLAEDQAVFCERHFYGGQPLEEYLGQIIDAAVDVHARVECYKAPVFARSAALLTAQKAHILGQRRILYHQDAGNMHFDDSRFSGFFDLEMCRVGTEAMQLGSLWGAFDHVPMVSFIRGYAEEAGRSLTGADLEASRAFAHFMVWRYITDYGQWHGAPLQGNEEEQAADYAQWMETIDKVEY